MARHTRSASPWQQHVDQLFHESRGGMNDPAFCEEHLGQADLDVGRAHVQAFYRSAGPEGLRYT